MNRDRYDFAILESNPCGVSSYGYRPTDIIQQFRQATVRLLSGDESRYRTGLSNVIEITLGGEPVVLTIDQASKLADVILMFADKAEGWR